MKWIEDAAGEIADEFRDGFRPPREDDVRVNEEIIRRHAAPLLALLRESKRKHGYDEEGDQCDKTNYLDGQHACSCGADAWNARVDAVLGEGKGTLDVVDIGDVIVADERWTGMQITQKTESISFPLNFKPPVEAEEVSITLCDDCTKKIKQVLGIAE